MGDNPVPNGLSRGYPIIPSRRISGEVRSTDGSATHPACPQICEAPALPSAPGLCNCSEMFVRRLFRLLLALLVTAGLMVAPLAVPAAGEIAMAATMVQGADAPGMAADMPCCPDKQKSNSCQDCPLVALCMLMALQTVPSSSAVPMRYASIQRLHPLDDFIADGLARPPPDQPPRRLV